MRALIIINFVCFSSCATPSIPYTVEFPTQSPSLQWFNDGAIKALTVVNPLPYAVRATVVCEPDDRWVVTVPAKGEARALIVEMVKDGYTNVCRVNEWHSAR